MRYQISERPAPSKAKRFSGILFGGGILGAVEGGLIGANFPETVSWVVGVFVGAIVVGAAEAITGLMRKEGESKPLWYRILAGAIFGAALGGLLGLIFEEIHPILLGVAIGAFSGLSTLNLRKIILGFGIGLVVGMVVWNYLPHLNPTLVAGAVVLLFGALSAALIRGEEPLRLSAERVSPNEVQYVVPFEANSKYIGSNYFQDLARTEGGGFKRNAPGIGIVETMETMRGPHFNPDEVHPTIREFYEHTSRYKLNIVPVWKNWMKPFYWWFKRTLAQPIGQANLPFDIEESQKGVVSYIDGIDFSCDDIVDLRGWVRAFKESDEAIYVGIYTTFRHQDVGYVSVGFPLPGANFTATLLPYNLKGGHFLLKSHNDGYEYSGHYLSFSEDRKLTVLALPSFGEEIEVYLQEGQLKTDHRFYLGGINFLTLYYTMERIESVVENGS